MTRSGPTVSGLLGLLLEALVKRASGAKARASRERGPALGDPHRHAALGYRCGGLLRDEALPSLPYGLPARGADHRLQPELTATR